MLSVVEILAWPSCSCAIFAGDKGRRQDFDSGFAAQSLVVCAVHLTHPANAD